MRNYLKVVSIVFVLLIFVGCASQSHSNKSNESSINELGVQLSTSKSIDGKKTVPSTSKSVATSTSTVTSVSTSEQTTPIKKDTKTDTKTDLNKEEKPLEGLTICIDAGHGKTTKSANRKEPIAPGSKIMKAATASGTSGVYTKISEESLNLTVSKKLQKALSDKGAKIIMIRETSKCDLTNVERTELWNSSGADLTIRIHGNGASSSKASGVLMMIPGDKYIKDKEMLEKSTQAGQYILDGVLKHTKAKSQGMVKSTDLTGFNWSKIPVILLEMGFMTNPQEDKLLNTDDYQNKIVLGIVEGVMKYQDNLIKDKIKQK